MNLKGENKKSSYCLDVFILSQDKLERKNQMNRGF